MNPGDDVIEKARRAFQGFHWGRPSRRVIRAKPSPRPAALVRLGRLEAITYSTKKGGDFAHWEHEFGEEGGQKPSLAMDPENGRLHIVGGDYTVEDRGIVD